MLIPLGKSVENEPDFINDSDVLSFQPLQPNDSPLVLVRGLAISYVGVRVVFVILTICLGFLFVLNIAGS